MFVRSQKACGGFVDGVSGIGADDEDDVAVGCCAGAGNGIRTQVTSNASRRSEPRRMLAL